MIRETVVRERGSRGGVVQLPPWLFSPFRDSALPTCFFGKQFARPVEAGLALPFGGFADRCLGKTNDFKCGSRRRGVFLVTLHPLNLRTKNRSDVSGRHACLLWLLHPSRMNPRRKPVAAATALQTAGRSECRPFRTFETPEHTMSQPWGIDLMKESMFYSIDTKILGTKDCSLHNRRG